MLFSISGRRTAALAVTGVLGLTGALALTLPAGAATDSGSAAASHSCSNASLHGRYVYHLQGLRDVENKVHTAEAGAEYYDGKGRIKTLSAGSTDGEISDKVAGEGTYKVSKDCTAIAEYRDADGEVTRYRLFLSDPDGESFRFTSLDDNTLISGDETKGD